MEKIFLSFYPYLGLPVLAVVCGCMADALTEEDFKIKVAEYIRRGQIDISLSGVLQSFDRSFIRKIFGERVLNKRFFFVSALSSLILFLIVVFLQAIKAKASFEQVIAAQTYFGVIFIVFLITFTILIDYICNIFSIRLIRVMSSSGRVGDTIVTFIANICLTTTLFSIVFPLGLVACLIANQYIQPPIAMKISDASPSQTEFVDEQLKLKPISADVKRFERSMYVAVSQYTASPNAFNSDIILALTKSGTDRNASIRMVARLLAGNNETLVFSREATVIPRNLNNQERDWNAFRLYSAAFGLTENARTGFLEIMRLDAIAIRLSAIYFSWRQIDMSATNSRGVLVKCASGTELTFNVDNDQLSTIGDKSEQACDSSFDVAITFAKGGSIQQSLSAISAGDTLLPLAALYLSSLTMSLLFYILIFTFYVGLTCIVTIKKIFNSAALKVKTLPFTLLGLITFCVIELVGAAMRWIVWI